jgi:exodeoxyribonuclease V alpha subunit
MSLLELCSGELFDNADHLLVDGARRLVERQESVVALELSIQAELALLIVARALANGHAAVDLRPASFERLLEDVFEQEGAAEITRLCRVEQLTEALRDPALSALIEEASLSAHPAPAGPPFVLSSGEGSGPEVPAYLTTRRLSYAEWRIASSALRSATGPARPLEGAPTAEELAQGRGDIEEVHRRFFERAINRPLSILTGGPGTGKTYSIGMLLVQLARYARDHDRSYSVALCAPTAKAAVRMRESLDDALRIFGAAEGLRSVDDLAPGLTFNPRFGSIHHLLSTRPGSSISSRTVDDDLLIVDEVSMLEFDLLDHLLDRAASANVVLVGDPNQLASVEVGAVLSDLVTAASGGPLGEIVTSLAGSQRSVEPIVAVADAICAGDEAALHRAVEEAGDDVSLVDDPASMLPRALQHRHELAASAASGGADEALARLSSFAILCANRQGLFSVDWWSRQLSMTTGGRRADRFEVGTPIMVLRNEYGARATRIDRLTNGDVGVCCASSAGSVACFSPVGGEVRSRELDELGRVEPGWAFTIHKSQGSEYEEVVISLPMTMNGILTRELLYTAVTRAKEKVVIAASDKVLRQTLARRVMRVSGLEDRIAALSRS